MSRIISATIGVVIATYALDVTWYRGDLYRAMRLIGIQIAMHFF